MLMVAYFFRPPANSGTQRPLKFDRLEIAPPISRPRSLRTLAVDHPSRRASRTSRDWVRRRVGHRVSVGSPSRRLVADFRDPWIEEDQHDDARP
jgi:hypothetical protein